jgi:Protein of unknown function (DUF2510)
MSFVDASAGFALPSTGVTIGLVLFAALFGALAYIRTLMCKRQTGRNPWGIPPLAWLVGGVLFGVFGAILAVIASMTTRPRAFEHGTGPQTAPPGDVDLGRVGPPQGAPIAAAPTPLTPAAGWYPDPSGRHQHRWWSGSEWSDQVVDDGFGRADPLGLFPG